MIEGSLSSLSASGCIANYADQRSQVERHIEGAFGSRHMTTKHASQLRAGRKARSTGKTICSTSSHIAPSFLRIDTRLYPSSYNSRPIGINLKFSGERQRLLKGNPLTTSAKKIKKEKLWSLHI